MQFSSARCGAAAALLAITAPCCGAAAQAAGPYDGVWYVTIACANAPDGAAGYTLQLTAQVRGGAIFGRFSSTATAAQATLSGRIGPDGSAALQVDGRTGDVVYSVGRVQPGTPYHYTANGRFAGNTGAARRNELRACDLTFRRG